MLRAKQIRLLEGEIVVGNGSGNGQALAAGSEFTTLVSNGTTVNYEYMGSLRDTNGNLVVDGSASGVAPVNYFLMNNSDAGNELVLAATGADTNIDIMIEPSGDGEVLVPTSYIPVNDFALVNKKFMDDAIQAAAAGLDVKLSARAMSTTTITLDGAQTVDGVTLTDGDRVVVAGQGGSVDIPHADNGIYVVNTAGAWTRAEDFDEPQEVTANAFTFIEEGNVWGDTGWVVVTDDIITIGTTALQWTQFSTPGLLKAGLGLNKVGDTFHVNTSTTIAVDGTDNVIVSSSNVAGQVLISGGVGGQEASWGALDLADSNAVTGVLAEANGGTGESTYTQGDLLIGDASSGLEILAVGAQDQVLTSNGTSASYEYVGKLRHTNGDVTLDVDASLGTDNYLKLSTASTGSDVRLDVEGTDTDIDLVLGTKGTGLVLASYPTLDAADPDEAFTPKGYVDAEITDALDNLQTDNLRADDGTASGSTMILDGISVGATAVNYLTVTNANTGDDVVLSVEGTDTNIDLQLMAKGSGYVVAPVGYDMSTGPDEAFATKAYVDSIGKTFIQTDELIYAAATVSTGTVNLAGFFTQTPLAGSVQITFNGLALPSAGFSVSGFDLVLDIDAIGYPIEADDDIASQYEYSA